MQIVVTIQNGDVQEVASTLKQLGMRVDSVLDSIGVITGQISEDKMPAVRSIPGVKVERDEMVQLPPPDAPVQ